MADKTPIEWTDATWNPITGCRLASRGCANCYAARLAATRMKNHPSRAGLARMNAAGVAKFNGKVRLNTEWLDQPLAWAKPRMIFVVAHGDLFYEAVPDAWIDQVMARAVLGYRHTYQILTKRADRMADYFAGDWAASVAALLEDLDERGLLDETLALLNPGGLYIVDDMLPQPNWETLDLGYDHPNAIRDLTATLESHPLLHVTKLSWATGIIIATRKAT